MKDSIGQKIEIGDIVVSIKANHREIIPYQVMSFTPKSLRGLEIKGHEYSHPKLAHPSQVKILKLYYSVKLTLGQVKTLYEKFDKESQV